MSDGYYDIDGGENESPATPPAAPVAPALNVSDCPYRAKHLPGFSCPACGVRETPVATAETAQRPFLYAIEDENGAWHDGESCVFSDLESAKDEVLNLNDDHDEPVYKVVPLYRVAPPPQPAGTLDIHGPSAQSIIERWLLAYQSGEAKDGDCKGIMENIKCAATPPSTGTPETLREAQPGTFREWWFNVGYKHMPKGDQPPEHAAIAELAWNAALAAVPQASPPDFVMSVPDPLNRTIASGMAFDLAMGLAEPPDYAAFVALAEQWDRAVSALRKVNNEGCAQRAADFSARAVELRATIAKQRKGQP